MEFVRKNMFYLVVGLVGLLAIGGAVWGSMAGAEVEQKLQQLEQLKRSVMAEAGGAANPTIIEEKRKRAEEAKAAFSETLEKALAKQKINAFTGETRKPFIDGILPTPASNSQRFDFRAAYEREYAKLFERMKARDKPTDVEIDQQRQYLRGMKQSESEDVVDPWFPKPEKSDDEPRTTGSGSEASLKDLLAEDAEARAAELVARQVYMYASERAIPKHDLARRSNDLSPSDDEIWQAHMQIWIAQDLAAALSGLNEKRAAELKAAGRAYDCWVAHMPVKHWQILRIDDKLGRGGGMNRSNDSPFADSFTGYQNDQTKFIVPLQLELVIEEAATVNVLDALCRAGFYTPIRVQYLPLSPDPLQREYIYGDDPLLRVRIDLEGYYFRKVFEDWINPDLKKILATPNAYEDPRG